MSFDSNSSSISTNSIEYREWESSVLQYNQHTDHILEDVITNYPNLGIRYQPPRARRVYRDREREQGEARLMANYFVDNPTYDEVIFRCRFRMQKHLFYRIVNVVTANDRYFQQRPDATGRLGLSLLQICTGAMRVLAYGTSFDVVDEYLRMSGAVTRKSLMKFVQGVIFFFGDEYLRMPNEDDLARLLHVGEQRGFPGSLNDINVLHRSPVFNDVLEGRAPKVSYIVNGHKKNMAYYLTEGIYPQWAAFIKSITAPRIIKHKLFAERQESVRKDVERAFGVLQGRFAFLRRPCLLWDHEQIGQIIIACIIMHNMIVEDERGSYQNFDPSEFFNETYTNGDDDDIAFSTERIADWANYMRNREQVTIEKLIHL